MGALSVKEIESKAAKIIRHHLGSSAKIYLFGSQAKETNKETSDIDIAVAARGNQPIRLSGIKEDLDKISTLRKIDIIDLSLTSEKFRKHILNYAIRL